MGIFDDGMKSIGSSFNPSGGGMFSNNQTTNTLSSYDQMLQNLGVDITKDGHIDLTFNDDGTAILGDKQLTRGQIATAVLKNNGLEVEDNKVNQMMDNPAFIMGLSLMNQASQGKNIGGALMPAAESTQAFITNQDLRKQNKKLMRDKQSGKILETIDFVQEAGLKDVKTKGAVIGLDVLKEDLQSKKYGNVMLGIDADSYFTKNKLNLEALSTSVSQGKVNLEQSEIILKYADKNEKIDYAFKEKNLEGLDINQKQALENLDASIIANNFAEYQYDKTIDKDKEFDKYIDSIPGLSVQQKRKYKLLEPEQIGEVKAAGTFSKAAEKLYNENVSSKSFGWFDQLKLSDQDELDIKLAIKDQILTLATNISSTGEPTRADIKNAEKMVIQGKGFTKNSRIGNLFGGEQFDIDVTESLWDSIFSGVSQDTLDMKAQGGTVIAGEPYIVGEHGPEVIVPHQTASVVSNQRTPGGYTWEEAIIDSSEMLMKIKQSSGLEEAKKALKKFRPDLYV
jgi:hypothetical protein